MNNSTATQQLQQLFGKQILSEGDFLGQKTVEVTKEELKDILKHLQPSFEVLMDLTAVDYIEPTKRTKILYLLHNPTNYQRITIATFVGRDESIPSVVDIWEGADWYERELFDLFGINFEGHPEMKRLLMPDDWQGHPLRKDYALTEESVQFKHGVKPKVPSEIIPYDRNRCKKT